MYALKQAAIWVVFEGQTLPLDGTGSYHVPDQWSDAEKEERFGLFLVIEDQVPSDSVITSEVLVDGGGRPRLARTFNPVPQPRQTVAKSVVQSRIIEAGKMDEAYAMLAANPTYFARWFAPDHPVVYCEDPDAVELVTTLVLDPVMILAP